MSLKRMLELKGTKRDVLRGGRAQALVGCQAEHHSFGLRPRNRTPTSLLDRHTTW